jgi:hypothetical protein
MVMKFRIGSNLSRVFFRPGHIIIIIIIIIISSSSSSRAPLPS